MTGTALARPVHLLGIDIGGTKSAVVLGRQVGADVEIVRRLAQPTRPDIDPLSVLRELAAIAEQFLAEAGLVPREVVRLGVCCGGPLDEINGIVLGPPNLPGWDHVPVVDFFEERLGIETRLSNDANAGAIAEWRWGAARGTETLAFLTFGTGLGAGLIIDGRLHRGWRGLAGEVGHVRVAAGGPIAYGKRGSWEGYSSGNGIRQLAIERVREAWARGQEVDFCPDEATLASIDVPALASAARAGDHIAADVFRTSGEFLGQGIAILADIVDPEVVVVGGIYGRCLDLLAEPTLERFAAESLSGARGSARIVPAALGGAIGDWSALAVAVAEPVGGRNVR
jgi:glucokinase